MDDPRLREILNLPAGKRLWYGGATAAGCVRGVTPQQAAWKPAPKRHSIWELTLHLAYWKYAVRRNLEASAPGTFPRSPANWPGVPKPADTPHWKLDRGLLRSEHVRLVEAVRAFDPRRLDEAAPWPPSDICIRPGQARYRWSVPASAAGRLPRRRSRRHPVRSTALCSWHTRPSTLQSG